MSTLLRDVPEHSQVTGAEDYVLRLTDSIGDACAGQSRLHVVTPAFLEDCGDAMALVAESVTSGVSRGAFLTGSFRS